MKKDLEKEMAWVLEEKYRHKPTEKFYKDVARLKAGEPVDYVIGFTEFLGCKIDLSKKTLIPRKDTEFWVEEVIKDILTFLRMSEFGKDKKIRVLDIFSGSGCIGVSVLKKIKNADVVFADKDNNCIEQIKINLKLNTSLIRANKRIGGEERHSVIKSDIFSKVRGKFDFIFANPPYVAIKKINNIQKSVLKYEPKIALFGGSDGLYYIKIFLSKAKNRLNPGGKIFMEFSPEQKTAIEKIILKNRYKNFEFKKDQNNRWRWVEIF